MLSLCSRLALASPHPNQPAPAANRTFRGSITRTSDKVGLRDGRGRMGTTVECAGLSLPRAVSRNVGGSHLSLDGGRVIPVETDRG